MNEITQICHDCATVKGWTAKPYPVGMWTGQCDVCGEQDVLLCAPLRLTVLNIKYEYAAVKENNPEDWQAKHQYAQGNLKTRRQQWAAWCANEYPVWMCNAPSHEITI